MRAASAGLLAVLGANRSLTFADLFTFAFPSGTQRLTNHGASITVGGNAFTGGHLWAPDLMGGIGGENAEVTVVVGVTGSTPTISGMTWLQAALAGMFEGVQVTVQRAIVAAGSSFAGYAAGDLLMLGSARVASADPAPDSTLTIVLQGRLSTQDVPVSTRYVQPGCPFTLGDTDCGVTVGSFTDARTAAAGSSAAVVKLSSSAPNAAPGSILRMTGGLQAGQARLVRSVSGVDATLDVPLAGAPAAGDGLTVQRGCAKSLTDCTAFANQVRFGGFLKAPTQGV